MAFKATRKEVMNHFCEVYAVSYCGIQHLMSGISPIAYTTSRTYGWRSNIYDIGNGIGISTGYGPIGKPVPYELSQKYEDRAKQIIENNLWDLIEVRKLLDILIRDFREELINLG